MDLWIRSQDKTNLIKVNHINIDNDVSIITANAKGEFVSIGAYANKARTLEVLTEIEKILNLSLIVENAVIKEPNIKNLYKDVKFIELSGGADIHPVFDTYVYEMPIS